MDLNAVAVYAYAAGDIYISTVGNIILGVVESTGGDIDILSSGIIRSEETLGGITITNPLFTNETDPVAGGTVTLVDQRLGEEPPDIIDPFHPSDSSDPASGSFDQSFLVDFFYNAFGSGC